MNKTPDTTNIEEIVDQVMELIETHGHYTSESAIYWDYGEPEELKKDITQTLKDYGDAVRREERSKAIRIVDDIYDYGIPRNELLDALDFGLNKQKGTP